MIRKPRSKSLVAAVVGASLVALTQPPIADAALTAKSANALTVTTKALYVYAADTVTASNPFAPYSVAITPSVKSFWIVNNGDISISKFTFTLTLPSGAKVQKFTRCAINVAFSGTNKCGVAGTAGIAVTITVGSPVVLTLNLPAGSAYAFQMDQDKNGSMTVNTLVSLADLTGATITNS